MRWKFEMFLFEDFLNINVNFLIDIILEWSVAFYVLLWVCDHRDSYKAFTIKIDNGVISGLACMCSKH